MESNVTILRPADYVTTQWSGGTTTQLTIAPANAVYADRDYILEDDGVMCCWRNRTSKSGDRVDFWLTVFEEREGGVWRRTDGVERERAWGLGALKNALGRAGLEFCGVSADYAFAAPGTETERWYITARKPRLGS